MSTYVSLADPLPAAWAPGSPSDRIADAFATVVAALDRWFAGPVIDHTGAAAAELRRLAEVYQSSDPGLAADLRATADRAF